MKLKATVSDVIPGFSHEERFALARLVIALNDPDLIDKVFDEVLVVHLRVPSRESAKAWGPAEFFCQECDRMIPRMARDPDTIGVDVTLSGVSVNARRASKDFWDALDKLASIYGEVIRENLPAGMKVQLFVRMALDKQIEYLEKPGMTSLPEQDPVLVVGAGILVEAVTPEVLFTAEARARLGVSTGDLLAELLRSASALPL